MEGIEKMTYSEWKLKLIELIVNDERLRLAGKLNWIKCALDDDCDNPQSYKEGKIPEDIWQRIIGAICDSQ
jgi:hypothetical protein